MTASVTGTQQDVYNVVWDLLTNILPTGVEIVKGQDNRVPLPKAGDYVVMTYMGQRRLSINNIGYNDNTLDTSVTQSIDHIQPLEVTIQLDVHGPNAGDYATVITTLFRSDFACLSFTSSSNLGIQPLYSSDPRQMAFTNDSNQYEDRWSIDAVIQLNQTVRVPVTHFFADTVTIQPVAATGAP